jgi:nucleotide-binding universal stress UspA family protein
MAWLPKKCVVAPIDFSDESLDAAREALQLVDSPEHLHLLHVLPALEVTDPGVIWATIDDDSRRSHALKALQERFASDARFANSRYAIEFGDPGLEVAEYARNHLAELVVLPSQGRTGLERVLLGSTAERVVRLCHCPVLVLRK